MVITYESVLASGLALAVIFTAVGFMQYNFKPADNKRESVLPWWQGFLASLLLGLMLVSPIAVAAVARHYGLGRLDYGGWYLLGTWALSQFICIALWFACMDSWFDRTYRRFAFEQARDRGLALAAFSLALMCLGLTLMRPVEVKAEWAGYVLNYGFAVSFGLFGIGRLFRVGYAEDAGTFFEIVGGIAFAISLLALIGYIFGGGAVVVLFIVLFVLSGALGSAGESYQGSRGSYQYSSSSYTQESNSYQAPSYEAPSFSSTPIHTPVPVTPAREEGYGKTYGPPPGDNNSPNAHIAQAKQNGMM